MSEDSHAKTLAEAQVDDAEAFENATEHTTFFHGINLRTQPVLTKRGRKTGKIVSRVFVILEGYLFYFQHPAATAPCGVLALQNAEYFVHSYASSALLGNFCIELRSPLRAWGTLILHFHGYTPMAIHEIKQMMNAAGAHPRRNQFDKNGIEIEHSRRSKRRPSRLITISNLIPHWARRNGAKHSTIGGREEDSVLMLGDTEYDADDSTTTIESSTVVCRVTKGSRTSLLKVNLRSKSIGNESATNADRDDGRPNSPRFLQLCQNTRLSFSQQGQPRRHFSLDEHEELVAEQDISPEHCHELCVNGFVENAGRKLLHFIWPWEGLQHLRPTRGQGDVPLRLSAVEQGANRSTHGARIRFASTFEASRQFDPATMGMMKQWASPQQQQQRLAICAADTPSANIAVAPVTAEGSVNTITNTSMRRNSINVASLQLALARVQHIHTPAAVAPLMPTAVDSKTPNDFSLKLIPPMTTPPSVKSVRPPKLASPASSPPKTSNRLPSPTSLVSKAKSIAHRAASPVTPSAPPPPAITAKVSNPPSPVKRGPVAPAASVPVIADIRVVQAVSIAESYSGGYMLRQYEPLKVIGRGGFGHVMVARHLPSGSLVAIKTLSKRAIAAQNQVQHSRAEKTVLTHCRDHPFIVKMHACFQTIDHLHIVLDYCPGGELFFHLSQRGHFTESVAAFYLAEVLLALEHLHQHDIIYRDLKPENILLDQQGHVRLADFGLSKPGIDDWTLAMTFCGSKDYIAPEVLALCEKPSSTSSAALPPTRGYGKAVDFWALGCMLFEMLTGQPPFYHATSRAHLYSMVLGGVVSFPPDISTEARDLMESLLRTDPRERLGARRASGGGATAVKQHPFFAKHHIDWTKLLNRTLRSPPLRPRPGAFANFDSEFTSMSLRGIDSMVNFPEKIPMDYQLFDNYNWEPPKAIK